MKIAILAGGSGTRLWPRSRASQPKQFLDLAIPEQSLLQETVERVLPLVSLNDILIVTSKDCARRVVKHLPGLPPHNVLAEPCGRGSAPAIGWAATVIAHRWGNETMVSLHSDHHVTNTALLRRALLVAEQAAAQGRIATLGIVPTRAHTGLGHVKRGRLLAAHAELPVYEISAFVEKPSLPIAEQYTHSGEYYWNTGMFVWKAETILREMKEHMPGLYAGLQGVRAALGTTGERRAVSRIWPTLAVEQIDYGVMEKTRLGAVVAVDGLGWSDLGDWTSLLEIHAPDANGNIVLGDFAGVDTSNSIIVGESRRLIGAIGLRDMIIVVTGDAVLVCPRARAQDVRKLVEKLRAEKQACYL